MGRILFYVVILAAGAALAFLVADIFISVAARQAGDVALEGPYALRHRPFSGDECDLGPTLFGLPMRDLTVGAVTTLFGITMQAVGGRMLRRG